MLSAEMVPTKSQSKPLRRLNDVGYGYGDPDRQLTLVTNPVGAFLAGTQASLGEGVENFTCT